MDLSNLPLLLPHYENVRRLRSDVQALIASMPSLVPGVQTFQVSAHQTQVLFFLKGSLEVNDQGVSCRVPVSLFFDPPYPSVPPRAFVSPENSSFQILATQYVDGNTGLIRLSTQWTPSVPASLVQRIHQIVAVLSEQIPLSAQAEAVGKLRQHWGKLLADIADQEKVKTDIEKKTAELTEYLAELKTEISALEAEIDSHKNGKITDPLASLKCSDALGESLLTGIAKAHALEDWLILIEEAFKQGSLSLDDFVKEIRTSKRSLFIERAAIRRHASLLHAAQTS